MHISELDAPSVLIDLDVMERNLRRMSEYCASSGMSLRPDVKTHKIPQQAFMQVVNRMIESLVVWTVAARGHVQ